jgi:hypothetical protein
MDAGMQYCRQSKITVSTMEMLGNASIPGDVISRR